MSTLLKPKMTNGTQSLVGNRHVYSVAIVSPQDHKCTSSVSFGTGPYSRL